MSPLKTFVCAACLFALPVHAEEAEERDVPAKGDTYFGQVQMVRRIPIERGGAKKTVAVDLRYIAKAACDRAKAKFIKGSVDVYYMRTYGNEVQYSASVQCK
jgi:hypothetical protein